MQQPNLLKLAILLSLTVAAWLGRADGLAGAEPRRLEFTRLIAHWDAYGDPAYLDFVEEAQPEIVQVGFYGAHFWSLAHTPHGQGYPAHLPLVGLAENGQWFHDLNRELLQRGAKVVGHFNVKFLVGDPDGPAGPRGFFQFYRDLWDVQELGPKPVEDPLELLEKNADGAPIADNTYSIGGMKEYWGCLNNPHWLAVLKAWTKRGIERGVDGFIINYFYRHNCLCEHCQREFKGYLSTCFTPAELNDEFGISDLAGHKFSEIGSWHEPQESTPLKREMLRFSQIANKRAFDEVFVKYGRSLQPKLIVAQWDHLGDFNQINGDERCLLPSEFWGKDEDYLWYSTGGAAYFTDLAEGFLGEATLQARYIRGAFDDKPFTLGKYESTRTRVTIAELAANGGAPMGFYTRFTEPAARAEIARYYGFMKRHDSVFHANRPHADVLLLYPRSRVHEGDLAAVEEFKKSGRQLLDRHVLFDVRPDDATGEQLSAYRQVVNPAKQGSGLSDLPGTLSSFSAPQTVRVSASRPATGDLLHVHFVNYNRQEPAEKRSAGGGIADEKPLAAPEVACDVALPSGFRAVRVQSISPEEPDPIELPSTSAAGRVQFTMPRFLVYGIAQIELAAEDGAPE